MKWQTFYCNFVYGVHPRKPRLTARILQNDFLTGGQTRIRYVDICVDPKYKRTCKHWFAENFKNDRKQALSISEWKNAFEQCHRLGNLAVAFTGAEPFIKNDLEGQCIRFKEEGSREFAACSW